MGKVGFEMQCYYYCSAANAFSVVYFCCTLLWLSKKINREKKKAMMVIMDFSICSNKPHDKERNAIGHSYHKYSTSILFLKVQFSSAKAICHP